MTVQSHGNFNYKKIVTLSTAKVENVSLTECNMKGMWSRNLLKEKINKRIKIKNYGWYKF